MKAILCTKQEHIQSLRNELDNSKTKECVNDIRDQLDCLEKSLVEVETGRGALKHEVATIDEKLKFQSNLVKTNFDIKLDEVKIPLIGKIKDKMIEEVTKMNH